jgi:hypothetical protein
MHRKNAGRKIPKQTMKYKPMGAGPLAAPGKGWMEKRDRSRLSLIHGGGRTGRLAQFQEQHEKWA